MSTATEMALYEITSELQQVTEMLVESGGELTPEIEEALDALEGALEEKVERTVHVIRQLEGQAEAAKAEYRRLQDLYRSRRNAADRLKEYLHSQLRIASVQKIEADTCVVRRQKNGRPSIAWEGDPDALPEAFRRVDVRPDTQAAYEEWRTGGELPEGFRVERGEHLRIR